MEKPLWTRREIVVLGAWGLSTGDWTGHRGRSSSLYRTKVLAKKPVGYWRLEEENGPTAHDDTQHGHDGTYQGQVIYHQPGALRHDANLAITLNGRDAYIEVPDSASFSQPTSAEGLTVEVWMRPELLVFEGQTQEHYIHWLGKGEPGQYEWGMRFYSRNSSRPNRVSAYSWNPDGGLGSGAYVQEELRRGTWMHIVACYAPGDKNDPRAGVSIYKNGLLRGSPQTQKGALYSTYDITPTHGNAPLRFGTRDLGSFLKGGLDEIAIYPRVLTAEEIRENYQAGRRASDEP